VIRLHSGWDRRGAEGSEAAANTICYLARYVNRVAISNGRLLAIEGDHVLFRYKDYRDDNQWKVTSDPWESDSDFETDEGGQEKEPDHTRRHVGVATAKWGGWCWWPRLLDRPWPS
jgi:hypothetical protein